MSEGHVVDEPPSRSVLRDLGFLSAYLHVHSGGRLGKQRVLIKLHDQGGASSQRELQQDARISSASLCETLSKLADEGFIERKRSGTDRRQFDVLLTERGFEQARTVKGEVERFEQDCLSCLDEEEQKTLIDLLDRVVAYWGSRADDG